MKKVYHNSLVSIIVPVYNSEKYIEKCIDSILNQTYKNLELILINDGSTDNSGHLCDVFANVDKRVKVKHMKNSGVSSARNKGMKIATGKFIQFVDSDDYIEPNMVEALTNETNNNSDMVLCGYKRISKDNNGKINQTNSKLYNKVYISRKMFLDEFGVLFNYYYINYLWNKLYVADIIKKFDITFDNSMNWGEDLIFNLNYLSYCNKITIIDKYLYNYIDYNNDSITSTFNSELYNNQQNMYKSVRKFLVSNDEYLGVNKEIVEIKFTNAMMMCLSNLFHSDSSYKKLEINNLVLQIIEDDIVIQNLKYFAYGSIQNKLVGKLIKHKSLNFIIYFFRTKSYIKNRMNFLHKILIKVRFFIKR